MMLERHQGLLGAAARLHERHRPHRPAPFNVFTVLRSASDEVNLHSRFLHALLDHRDPFSQQRENLEAFVRTVVQAHGFDTANANVERESDNIDLLISNPTQAIVVENKIWAGDQERQLERYRNLLLTRGYGEESIWLVYLTPFGHEPSEESVGEMPAHVEQVSYRENLPDWLLGCQRRAFDDPGLRESIAQYLRLIRRMTHNDYEAEHMNELKELLLRDDNLVLADQISKSLIEAEVELVKEFYEVIDRVLHEEISDLPGPDPDYAHLTGEQEIRRCVIGTGRGLDSGLYYRVAENVWLSVAGRNRLWLGVSCEASDDASLHGKLREALAGLGGTHRADDWAPWWRHLDELPSWGSSDEWLHIRAPNEATLRFLSDKDSHEEFGESVAKVIGGLWAAIKEHGLADRSG